MASNATAITKTISAEDTFSDAFTLYYVPGGALSEDKVHTGWANISISGVSDSTVTIQRKTNGASTWMDVADYTASIERSVEDHEYGVQYRVGVKIGNYGTDTISIRISG